MSYYSFRPYSKTHCNYLVELKSSAILNLKTYLVHRLFFHNLSVLARNKFQKMYLINIKVSQKKYDLNLLFLLKIVNR